MNVESGLVSAEQARKILKVSDNTLRQWVEDGNIECFRPSQRGHRRYNVKKFIEDKNPKIEEKIIKPTRKRIVYARVSTQGQSENLKRQVEFLSGKYPNHTVITDIGSGINFKREGLKTILELAFKNELEEVVVAYKDRLCRFAFELIEFCITKFSNAKLVVLNHRECSSEQELSDDIISIITVFSAKINGRKRYKDKNIKNDES